MNQSLLPVSQFDPIQPASQEQVYPLMFTVSWTQVPCVPHGLGSQTSAVKHTIRTTLLNALM